MTLKAKLNLILNPNLDKLDAWGCKCVFGESLFSSNIVQNMTFCHASVFFLMDYRPLLAGI